MWVDGDGTVRQLELALSIDKAGKRSKLSTINRGGHMLGTKESGGDKQQGGGNCRERRDMMMWPRGQPQMRKQTNTITNYKILNP